MKKIFISIFLILISLLLVNCPDKPVDNTGRDLAIVALATRSTSASVPAAGSTTTRPSSCNTSGLGAGCTGSSRPFTCTASPTCYATYDACAADTTCQSFTYATSTLTRLRIGDTVNTTPNSFPGTSPTFAVTTGTLPAGVSINATTGAITGNTTAALSTTNVTVTATNTAGSITATLSFRVFSAAETTAATCNTTGISGGCTAGNPFSCSAATQCATTVTACLSLTGCAF